MRPRALLPLLLIAALLPASGPTAADIFDQARKAEKAGRLAEAYLLYSQAAALDPEKREYWRQSQAIKAGALVELEAARQRANSLPPDAANAAAEAFPHFDPPAPQDLLDSRRPLPLVELAPDQGIKDFDLRGDARKLFGDVAAAFGLDCAFDPEYQAGNSIRFRVKSVDYRDALHALEAATASFVIPLTAKRILIAKDTPAKRTELEPAGSISVEVSQAASQQDLSAVIQVVQQSLGLEKVSWNAAQRTIVIRDRVSKLLPAQALLRNFLRPRAEVGIEMQFMEVSLSDALTYGVRLQTQIPLFALTEWMSNSPSFSDAISGLLTIGGGKTMLGLGVIDPSLVATMSKSSGSTLMRSVLTSTDGMPASFHVGDKYPVMTSGYFGPASFQGEDAYRPIPSFNFEDLGLTLKLTPTVHGDQELTLDIDASFKLLSGAALDGIPIIANRSLKSKARLAFGEWAVVSGLMNRQEARSIAGMAVLSRIPFLGPLLSTRSKDDQGQQVLILMRPFLLSPPPGPTRFSSIPLGTDARPRTPL